jgi:very-short-patch-repair endonuclease
VRILKLFLEYAETGKMPSISVPGGDSESPFEDAVYEFLVSGNNQVHKQIGCAGFRIDLAVVDPRHPGRYLLGIECDGAQYHSSKVARDRDRLRHQILVGLGWKIHRVWSTDWYRNSPDTKRKLLETVERVKSEPVAETPKPKAEVIRSVPLNARNSVIKAVKVIPDHPIKPDSSTIPEYTFCTTADLGLFIDFAEVPSGTIENAIMEIVRVEGPVHIEEVYERIRNIGNIPRMTGKIKDRIIDACDHLAGQKRVRLDYNFLWPPVMPSAFLRRRKSDHGADISWICNEEIAAAVYAVLTQQYATGMDDLVSQVLKIFGYQRPSDKSRSRIRKIISKMIDDNALMVQQNGMIDVRK